MLCKTTGELKHFAEKTGDKTFKDLLDLAGGNKINTNIIGVEGKYVNQDNEGDDDDDNACHERVQDIRMTESEKDVTKRDQELSIDEKDDQDDDKLDEKVKMLPE